MRLLRCHLLPVLLLGSACSDDATNPGGGSTQSGASAPGGSSSDGASGPSGGGGEGSGAGVVSGGAGAGAAGGGGGSGGAEACTPTPGTVVCGDDVCDLDSEYCCGGPESGQCFAQGAFCGLGGIVKIFCDDPSDCQPNEVCCPKDVPKTGNNDAPYETSCGAFIDSPDGGPDGCGMTGGGFSYPALCACDSECYFGNCELSTTVYIVGNPDEYMSCQI